MSKQRLGWKIKLMLLPVLVWGLLGCSGQSQSAAPTAAAVPPTNTPVAELEASPPPPPPTPTTPPTVAPTETPAVEEVMIDFTTRTGLETLSAYRSTLTFDFEGVQEGQPTTGQGEVLTEFTREPEARYIRMQVEGSAFEELGGSATLEVYTVDQINYLQFPGDDSWLALPAEAASYEEEMVLESFIDLPTTARRNPQPETIQGLAVEHYSFTEADMADPGLSLEQAQGELWVAVEGGYVVKYEVEATISATDPELPIEESRMSRAFDAGSLHLTYELADINSDLTIILPEEAAAAGPDPAGLVEGLTETEQTDNLELTPPETVEDDTPGMTYWGTLPSPDDVFNLSVESNGLEDILTATSFSDLPTVLALYRQELPKRGWQEKVEAAVIDETQATLLFEGPDLVLRLELSQPPDSLTDIRLTTTVAEGAVTSVDLSELPRPENIELKLEQPDYLRYDVDSDLDTMLEFYRTELTALGWRERAEFGYIQNWSVSRFFRKGNFSLNVLLLEIRPNKIGVDLDLRDLAAEAVAAEATATARESLPPLVAGEPVVVSQVELPVLETALDVQVGATTLSYLITADPHLLFEFYHVALSESGWRQIEAGSKVDGSRSQSTYRFTNSDESQFLMLTLSDEIPVNAAEANELSEIEVLLEVTGSK